MCPHSVSFFRVYFHQSFPINILLTRGRAPKGISSASAALDSRPCSLCFSRAITHCCCVNAFLTRKLRDKKRTMRTRVTTLSTLCETGASKCLCWSRNLSLSPRGTSAGLSISATVLPHSSPSLNVNPFKLHRTHNA